MVRECWFCGEETPPSWHDHVLGLHKDADTTMTPWIVVLRSTWRMEIVSVPRCSRCHTGHQIERTAAVLSVAALIAYAASGQLDRLLGILSSSTGERVVAAVWAAVACLPGLAWIAIRLGGCRGSAWHPAAWATPATTRSTWNSGRTAGSPGRALSTTGEARRTPTTRRPRIAPGG